MSAVLSAVAVVGVAGWQISNILEAKGNILQATATVGASHVPADGANELDSQLGTATSSTPDEISQIGVNAIGELATNYAVATQHTPYTPTLGAQIVAAVTPTVIARIGYSTYDTNMIPTTSDTSSVRKLQYRTDLHTAFIPLTRNTTYELDLYNDYVQTQDHKYLDQLKTAAQNYRDTVTATAHVIVPANAVTYQVNILNAMQKFATTIDTMADNTADPITSVVLLNSYNQAESDMYSSFGALNAYLTQK